MIGHFRYQQPPDNNMDYGSAEMLADQRRMIEEGRLRMARARSGEPPHNLRGTTQHGSLTHSKANSSFVVTPATSLGKPSGLRKTHSRGRKRY